nr:hypothetical protein BaRGS_009875 [Batillaria attramentaria]
MRMRCLVVSAMLTMKVNHVHLHPTPLQNLQKRFSQLKKKEGLHLSLSLPSADVDIADEPDTGRLLEEADKYVQIQKEKEAEKIKLLQADTSSGILAGHEFQGSTEFEETHTKVNTSVDFTGDAKESSLSNNDAMRIGSETGFKSPVTNARLFADAVKISPAEDGMSAVSDTLHPSDEGEHSAFMRESDTRLSGLGESFDDSSLIESESDPTESPDKHPTGRMTEMSLPPGVEYLGPTKHEQRNRTHPLFLMRDDKPAQKLMKPHPPTDKTGKLETRPPPHHRVGVHIREDRNVTVDITPRNLGRKVADITSSKKSFINQSREDAMSRGEGRPGPLSQQRTGDTDLEVTATKVTHQSSRGTQLPSAAATVTVCYDDDSDGSSSVTGSRKKKRRRPRPLKEKDIVTMVGGMDDDDDDPEREVDLDLGSEGEDDSATNCSRSPSAVLSAGEKNYYNIGRHRRPNGDGSDTEEKENIITVTTKTFEFDADKPRESVVKKILEAPLLKQRERQTPSFLEGSSSRPKSAAHGPRSPKLSVSEMHRVSPPGGKHHGSSQGGLQGCVESGDGLLEPEEEDRPLSRMGFFSEEPSPDTDNEGPKENTVSETPKVEPTHRPPSGKRRPLSATNKANRPAGTETSSIRQSRKETKENIAIKRRPSSASPSVGRNPSAVEIQRANAAVRALRSEESMNSASKSAASSRSKETRREYSSYSTAHARSQQRRAGFKSAPPSGRAVHLTSKNHLLEEEDTESLEECREIQGRLACYGIDVKAETLERALFPPSGRTLHYDLSAKLPRSYSAGLLSHPRVWLPEEHRKLKIAEKKLAMVELSLWRQKRAEERKAKLAAEKEAGENGKKKKKKKAGKKLRRNSSPPWDLTPVPDIL